jgi:hypothetical protein
MNGGGIPARDVKRSLYKKMNKKSPYKKGIKG